MKESNTVFKKIRFPLFLAALLIFLVFYPYFHVEFTDKIYVVELFFALLMITGVGLLVERKGLLLFMSILAILVLFGILLSGYTENKSILLITIAVELLFFLIIFQSLFVFIYSQKKITSNKLYAAITSYLVLGIIFALIFTIVTIISPEAFRYTISTSPHAPQLFPHPGFFSEALYFSFVTLSTLGYGDWVPLFGSIKMIASLEAIIGQLFIAIMIARLVGVQISQSIMATKREDFVD